MAELKFASKDGRGIKATMFVLKPYIPHGFNTNSQFTSIQGRMLVNRMATEGCPVGCTFGEWRCENVVRTILCADAY